MSTPKFAPLTIDCLHVRQSGTILAVVETKSFRPAGNPDAMLMQIGFNIMAHILDYHEQNYNSTSVFT